MIDSMSDEELFQPHMRKWADDATKTARYGKFTSLFTLILLLLSELLELRLENGKGSIVNLSLSSQNMIWLVCREVYMDKKRMKWMIGIAIPMALIITVLAITDISECTLYAFWEVVKMSWYSLSIIRLKFLKCWYGCYFTDIESRKTIYYRLHYTWHVRNNSTRKGKGIA